MLHNLCCNILKVRNKSDGELLVPVPGGGETFLLVFKKLLHEIHKTCDETFQRKCYIQFLMYHKYI